MPLYEVAILEKPTDRERRDGKIEKLVFGPEFVVASDEQSAAISAVLGENRPNGLKLDRSEVLVRPFA